MASRLGHSSAVQWYSHVCIVKAEWSLLNLYIDLVMWIQCYSNCFVTTLCIQRPKPLSWRTQSDTRWKESSLYPPLLLSPSSPSFHFVSLVSSLQSHHRRLVIVPRTAALHQKRKWENGKSCSLLWHPCLPTHNAVLRFVQLPRSLLVCMYPCAPPPTRHLFLIAQQRRGMLYFPAAKPFLQHYSTTTNPLIVIVLRGVCQKLNTEREWEKERRLSMLHPHHHWLKIRQRSELGGISTRHLLLPWWVEVGA